MGLGLSAATVIIFSAIVIISADFINTYDAVSRETRDAIDGRDELAFDRAGTSIGIMDTNVTGGTLWMNVTNDGSSTIGIRDCDLLVNGTLSTGSIRWNRTGIAGHPGSDLWGPGETAMFAVDGVSAPARVKIVSPNGISDTSVVV